MSTDALATCTATLVVHGPGTVAECADGCGLPAAAHDWVEDCAAAGCRCAELVGVAA